LRVKTLAAATFSAAAVLATAAPAFAAGSMTVNPATNLVDGQAVTLTWTGFTAPVTAAQCSKSIAAPGFDPSIDCDYDTNGGVVNAGQTGTATFNVFKGDRPLLGWSCGPSASGLEVRNTCYIRVTQNGNANVADDIELPITFAPDNPVVPEVPYSVLLPMGAIAALGAGLYLNRRRVAA
jgi:hypothetical protein